MRRMLAAILGLRVELVPIGERDEERDDQGRRAAQPGRARQVAAERDVDAAQRPGEVSRQAPDDGRRSSCCQCVHARLVRRQAELARARRRRRRARRRGRRRAARPRRRSRAPPRRGGCVRPHSRCACRAPRCGPARSSRARVPRGAASAARAFCEQRQLSAARRPATSPRPPVVSSVASAVGLMAAGRSACQACGHGVRRRRAARGRARHRRRSNTRNRTPSLSTA